MLLDTVAVLRTVGGSGGPATLRMSYYADVNSASYNALYSRSFMYVLKL